jgi:hypothetical protein
VEETVIRLRERQQETLENISKVGDQLIRQARPSMTAFSYII